MENTYKKIIEKEFKKQITEFKSPVEIIFLLNVLSLILDNGWQCCKVSQWQSEKMCRITYFFWGFEKDLGVNQFDYRFFVSYLRLVNYLFNIFYMTNVF